MILLLSGLNKSYDIILQEKFMEIYTQVADIARKILQQDSRRDSSKRKISESFIYYKTIRRS